jgi:predicted transcriptional regulator
VDVQFTPDLQARVHERAAQQGLDRNVVVQNVVARYFEEEDRFIEAVRRREAALERGEFLRHEEVGARLRVIEQPKGAAVPTSILFCVNRRLSLSIAAYSVSGFFIRRPSAFCLALIPKLLALG